MCSTPTARCERRGERVEEIADELRVREVVHGEGEPVAIHGGIVSVDDHDAGIGHQSAQRAHRAGIQQALRLRRCG